jgi:hypothetical protein
MAWLNAVLRRNILTNLCAVGVFLAVFYAANTARDVALHDVQYFNGWILVICVVILMLLTMRKRVVILPFARVRFWLLVHYYVGFATIGVFLVHTRFRLPDSPLEWVLWCLFVLIAVSGLFGALISKIIPPRLEAHGERILFERIPVFRAQLAAEAEALARDSVKDGDTVSISKLYVESLGWFFSGPRHVFAHLQSSNLPLARLLGEIATTGRYLDDAGKRALARMRELVEAKNNLDFHYANGALLRLWLFLHVPASYALLVTVVAHVVLAYAFAAR